MLINLTDYFKNPEKKDKILVEYEGGNLSANGSSYPVNEGKRLEITVESIGNGQLSISGQGEYEVVMPCDRCVEDVTVPVQIEFDYTVNEPDGYHELSEDDEEFMKGYDLDGDTIIHNELIMGLPMKVLCKDDCKGLCPVCGSNRNKGECGCDTFVPDPRMAAIQDIFNANK